MTDSTQRCLWSSRDLEDHDVPLSTKEFLVASGLPRQLGNSTMEFSVFDGAGRCVIGVDFDHIICVKSDGSVWYESVDGNSQSLFMNSSVEFLDQFIAASDALDLALGEAAMVDAGNEVIQSAIDCTEQRMRELDPVAFA